MINKENGFILVELLTYLFVFSLIILLTFNLILYFANNLFFLLERPPLKHSLLEEFDRYFRFATQINIIDNEIYFTYKKDDYHFKTENNNILLYKNSIKELESNNYSILDVNFNNNNLSILFEEQQTKKEVFYSVSNIN
jgi:hypothetical protein